MKKPYATLVTIVLLTLSGCNWGATEQSGQRMIRTIIRNAHDVPLARIGSAARTFQSSIRSRVTEIAGDFPSEVKDDVIDVTKEVLCFYLDYLEKRNPPSLSSVIQTTTGVVNKRGYSLEDTYLPNQIYNTLNNISVSGVSATDGLQMLCAGG
jgi:hypothetical protein